jgi:hypothetical protein
MSNTDRVVKLLAAKYAFDPVEGAAFLAAAAATKAPPKVTPKTPPKVTPKSADFLEGLAAAEALDAAKAAAKAAKKEAKAAKAAAKAAKEPRPKRAPTGYLLFCADLRPEVKAALEEQLAPGEKLKPSVTVTELALQWKALTEEERAEWNAKAAVIKELMVVRTSGDGSESE